MALSLKEKKEKCRKYSSPGKLGVQCQGLRLRDDQAQNVEEEANEDVKLGKGSKGSNYPKGLETKHPNTQTPAISVITPNAKHHKRR